MNMTVKGKSMTSNNDNTEYKVSGVVRKDTTIYDEVNTFVNKTTGEIISSARKKLVKREKTPEFTMLFIHGLSVLTKSELTKAQAQTLFELLKYTVNNSNMLMINADVKNLIANDSNLKFRTVEENIKALVKKEILIRQGRTYFLSPIIFGRGNWNDIKTLTQSLEVKYDFVEGTAVEKLTTKTLYNTESELRDSPHEVVEAVEYDDGTTTHQELVVSATQRESTQMLLELDPEIKTTTDNDIELIKQENEKKRLENESMLLKLQMKKEGLLD